MDEQSFLARIRRGTARTAPHAGDLASAHGQRLRRHGAAAGDTSPAPPSVSAPAVLGELAGLPAPGEQAALADHFAREFTALGGHAQQAATAAALGAAAVAVAQEVLARRGGYVCVAAQPALATIAAALAAADIPMFRYHGPADRARLAGCSLGVTTVAAAIAETGTLVIETGPAGSRYASLLAPVHLAVVPADCIWPGLAGWLNQRGSRFRAGEELPSSIAFATGPSRSADIAGQLTLGVHGPGEVHAIIAEMNIAPLRDAKPPRPDEKG